MRPSAVDRHPLPIPPPLLFSKTVYHYQSDDQAGRPKNVVFSSTVNAQSPSPNRTQSNPPFLHNLGSSESDLLPREKAGRAGLKLLKTRCPAINLSKLIRPLFFTIEGHGVARILMPLVKAKIHGSKSLCTCYTVLLLIARSLTLSSSSERHYPPGHDLLYIQAPIIHGLWSSRSEIGVIIVCQLIFSICECYVMLCGRPERRTVSVTTLSFSSSIKCILL